MDTTVIPQSKTERAAFVAKMFTGVVPAESKPLSLVKQLSPLRHDLLVKRREGFSLRQIAEQLKRSPVAAEVSPATIRVLLAGPAAKRKATLKKKAAQRAAALAARTAAAGSASTATPPATPATAAASSARQSRS